MRERRLTNAYPLRGRSCRSSPVRRSSHSWEVVPLAVVLTLLFGGARWLRFDPSDTKPPKVVALSSSVYYRNCAAARAAGAAPVHISEPGYGSHLDADGDGIGCEPYRPHRMGW